MSASSDRVEGGRGGPKIASMGLAVALTWAPKGAPTGKPIGGRCSSRDARSGPAGCQPVVCTGKMQRPREYGSVRLAADPPPPLWPPAARGSTFTVVEALEDVGEGHHAAASYVVFVAVEARHLEKAKRHRRGFVPREALELGRAVHVLQTQRKKKG